MGAIAPANAMPDLADGAVGQILSHAGDVVHAAHFLNGSGRDSEGLAADAEQDDLFGARLVSIGVRRRVHQRTPTGVARVSARTRFSSAA